MNRIANDITSSVFVSQTVTNCYNGNGNHTYLNTSSNTALSLAFKYTVFSPFLN